MNPWLLLMCSIVAEVAGTLLLKASHGLTRLWPTLSMGVCYLLAIWLMGLVSKKLEIGLTYAVWAGVGTAATALLGVWIFNEGASLMKVLGVGFIVAGVVLLNLSQSA